MEILGFEFEGPFDHNETFTADFGCIYVIIDSNSQLIDVGQTNNINDRLPSHERRTCWLNNNCPGKNLFVHTSSNETYRLDIEEAIRDKYKPACGVR